MWETVLSQFFVLIGNFTWMKEGACWWFQFNCFCDKNLHYVNVAIRCSLLWIWQLQCEKSVSTIIMPMSGAPEHHHVNLISNCRNKTYNCIIDLCSSSIACTPSILFYNMCISLAFSAPILYMCMDLVVGVVYRMHRLHFTW